MALLKYALLNLIGPMKVGGTYILGASEDTRRSSPYFNRRYDLYVIAATQVSHAFQDLARQSQRRDGAVWHYMKRCSQTVLLDTLRQGYGILIEDDPDEAR